MFVENFIGVKFCLYEFNKDCLIELISLLLELYMFDMEYVLCKF